MTVSPGSRDRDSADRFRTTRWSVILASSGDKVEETERRDALAQLCRTYWRPVFAYICRHGNAVVDAQDLTQEFFFKVLRGDLLRSADPKRGRFRSLLLKALQNFLHDTYEKQSAKKRGGDFEFVSWDDWAAEAPSQLKLPAAAAQSWAPERLFDIRWAATVVEQALRRLREECEARGRRRVFDALRDCLTDEQADTSYEDRAKALNVPSAAIKRLIYQLRRRYRELLREEVSQTVEQDAEIEDEVRYLCSMLAAAAA